MAFENLSEKLQGTFKKLKGKGVLTEADINDAMREVKLALLEADVNFKVVKEFVAEVKEKALGQGVLESLTPGQQVIKIVNDTLVDLMGGTNSKLTFSPSGFTVLLMVGLQGTGKTTTCGKLAAYLKKHGKKPMLAAPIASTAQLVNANTRKLEDALLNELGLTQAHFGRFVYPGDRVGVLTKEVQRMTGLGDIPVIAVAGHDTASAVAAVPAMNRNFAYLSSGTWSLMGIEADAPVINKETEELNFTNEGGVEGTIRLLKNICGMWLLERCRAEWGETSYPELIAEADACEPFRSLINPDDALFANPANMEQAIRTYCSDHCQPIPRTRGQMVRCIFESLALRYRQVLDNLRHLSPRPVEVLHVIGGGSRNDLLNQWTANAVGVPVITGPSEATAIGNVMIQALTGGAARDVASMRQLINRSIPLKTFHPQDMEVWDTAYLHFGQLTADK